MHIAPIVLCLAAALSFGQVSAQSTVAPQAADAVMKRPGDASKSWTVTFDRTAKSDGQVKLMVWQNDEDAPREIVVPIKQGQTENSIALQTRDVLRDTLGQKDFIIDVAKGNVFLRTKHGERRFSVQVGENSAAGVKIDLYAR